MKPEDCTSRNVAFYSQVSFILYTFYFGNLVQCYISLQIHASNTCALRLFIL